MAHLITKLRRATNCPLPIIAVLLSLAIALTYYATVRVHEGSQQQRTGIKQRSDDMPKHRRLAPVYVTSPPDHNEKSSNMDWTCSKQVSLLTPSMGPFQAWREYKLLQQSFHKPKEGAVSQFELTCPKHRCNITIGATLTDKEFLRKSDGVVINIAPNLLKTKLASTAEEMSHILREDVTWFFLGMESPQMFTYWDPEIANIKYHNAITYNSLSALPVPYGYYVPSNPMDDKPRPDLVTRKTKLIAWMASNCDNTFWPRYDFVQDLLKYLPIDMYGKCGNLTCLPPMSEKCNNMLQSYKFYLALENTECDEYISEKVWQNCLSHGVVPIVYGGRKSAYERLAPPNSFIHVSDFENLQELANYLKELDNDDENYSKYFEWRRYGHVKINYPPFSPEIFCDTIPLMDVSSREHGKQPVSNSKYFNTCRGKPHGIFAKPGSYENWSPWR